MKSYSTFVKHDFVVTVYPSRLSIRNKVLSIYLCIKPKLQWGKKILICVRKCIKIILTVLLPDKMESFMNSHIDNLYIV